jgi:FdhE protein
VTIPEVAAPTFEGLAREHPEWRGWLGVMRAALDEAADPDWQQMVVVPSSAHEPGAPWLAGASITLDERLARRWMRTLLQMALDPIHGGAGTPLPTSRIDALDHAAFLRAAVVLDIGGLEAAGQDIGLSADLARALAHPAVLPLLATCAARAEIASDGWGRGHCPVCGAWPSVVELRGLEASRRLRCGRCGADWAIAWLACVYCGNDDHRQLGGLVSESAGAMRRLDTCQRCHGYVKSVTTLMARTHAEVVLEDVATVAYDVTALDEGASRPPGLAWPLQADLTLGRRAGLLRWRR